MKITESNVILASSRNYAESYEKTETMKYWVGDQRPSEENNNEFSINLFEQESYKLEISEEAKQIAQDVKVKDISKDKDEDLLSEQDKIKIQLVEKFIEIMTGKKIKIKIMDKLKIDNRECPKTGNSEGQTQRAGWGFEYDFHERYSEKEVTIFEAAGIIKTADGKEIKIDLNVNMSREFAAENNISVRAGDAKIDPLVINYEGHSANITQTKYEFDLDCDGEAENISFAGQGSGFLAIDNNNDNIINNGSELFGPKLGNGFTELSEYDLDKNGWIDENDDIFSKLRIWSKDQDGNDYLFALGEKGIGAIYLGNIGTQFSIKDMENAEQAQVVSSGIFLKEDGTVGTVQHIDLVV